MSNPSQLPIWYLAEDKGKHVRQVVFILPKEAQTPPCVKNLELEGDFGRAFNQSSWAATAAFLNADTNESNGPFVFAKASNAVKPLEQQPVTVALAFYQMEAAGIVQLFVQVDSPDVVSELGRPYIAERAFDLSVKENVELLEALSSIDDLEICFLDQGEHGPCTSHFSLKGEMPELAKDALRIELKSILFYHENLHSRNPRAGLEQYNQENPLEDSPILKPEVSLINYYGMTEEEAISLAKSENSTELFFATTVTLKEKAACEGMGPDQDAAIRAAQNKIPSDAINIEPPEILNQWEDGFLEIEAWNDQDATRDAENKKPFRTKIGKVECVKEAKKGFLGIGKKPAFYKVQWIKEPCVRISYLHSVKLTVHCLKKYVALSKEKKIEIFRSYLDSVFWDIVNAPHVVVTPGQTFLNSTDDLQFEININGQKQKRLLSKKCCSAEPNKRKIAQRYNLSNAQMSSLVRECRQWDIQEFSELMNTELNAYQFLSFLD